MIGVAIPAHDEAKYIGRCLDSIRTSADAAGVPVEIAVALNRCTDETEDIALSHGATCVVEDRRSIAAVRNAAVRATTADRVITIDADSWMNDRSISEAIRLLDSGRYIGGGTATVPERWSPGIVLSVLAIAPYILRHRVSGGMFWFERATFDELGGFDESLSSLEDLDFARRLRTLGRERDQRFGTIRKGRITTSARKFDQFGDAYLFRNPRLVRRLFSGTDHAAADEFYYDADR